MSKYTTQLRFYIDFLNGLEDSPGLDAGFRERLENARAKIFDFSFPIFDEEYRKVLEMKILLHFYTRELGFETPALWKLKLCDKLNLIMPYYNQLYKSAELEFNPLDDFKTTKIVKTTRAQTTTGTETIESENTTGTTGKSETQETGYDLFSDTPQGGLANVETDMKYLTEIRKTINNNSVESEASTTDNGASTKENTGTLSGSLDVVEEYFGKKGGGSYAQTLTELRNTFINIDLMIMNELNDLFMLIW